VLVGCADDPEPLTHGSIAFEFRRGESQEDNPFLGTVTVIATMDYQECLSEFYDANAGMRQEGVEGAEIFGKRDLGGEGWTDRLCDTDLTSMQAKCEVIEMRQQLDIVKQLTITYQIQTDNLEGLRLAFGPIPTAETADCQGGLDPRMRVAPSAVKGQDGSENPIWDTEAFQPQEAVTNQGAPIRIAAARE
jgi:hypothetical protein